MKKRLLLGSTIACACVAFTPAQGFALESSSKTLSLSRDGILTTTKEILNQIKSHPDLQEFNLAGVYQAADPVVMQSIHDNLPNLKELNLSGYVDYDTSDDGPAFDYSRMQKMDITPDMLTKLLSGKSSIESLNLSISNLNDQGLKVIAQNGSRLKEINLTGTAVTEQGVRDLIARLPNLKEIVLGQVKMTSSVEAATLGFAPSQDLIAYANNKRVKLTIDNQKY
jgi:hypothetical protein